MTPTSDAGRVPRMNSSQAGPIVSDSLWGLPVRFIAALLFVIALLPRLPGLDRFLTSDENTNIFFAGSDVIVAFLQGNLRGTYWHFYPGVTMSWLDAIGMAGQYGLAALSGADLPPFVDYVYSDILALVVANRLPYAILTALAVPAVYLLARKLLPDRMALLGALFLAFDPFFLAHSRVAHGDAPLAVFMALSTLSFFVYLDLAVWAEGWQAGGQKRPSAWIWAISFLRQPATFYLVASAVCGGLAALTKAPGPFMALFVTGLSLLYAVQAIYRTRNSPYPSNNPHLTVPESGHISRLTSHVSRILLLCFAILLTWALISLAVFALLWPAMWVDSVGTVGQMWIETFGKVDEGHLVYFFGRPTLDPGPWFYLYVIPFRLTPVVLSGAVLSFLLLGYGLRRLGAVVSARPGRSLSWSRSPLFLLWLFTIGLLLFGNLSPKKQDRYLLPLFPFLDLLAAVGWLGALKVAWHFIRRRGKPTGSEWPVGGILSVLLVAGQLAPVFTYYPYYLAYFNPLMGGPTRAAETTLMGWGEGMEQAAAYLNSRPNAAELTVAATPSQTLLPYFAGSGENFYTNDVALRADYVVLYLAQMQRLAPSPEIVRYFQNRPPEKVITIKDVPYVKIYPGPRLILGDIPPEATPANIGLEKRIRLAGYHLEDITLPDLRLTLYWHALAPLAEDYTISVRALDSAGKRLAQQDGWPVDGLLPTSQWRQGDYVADSHTLSVDGAAPPARGPAALSGFEVVVYNAATGETLGPPILLPVNGQVSPG